VALVGLYDGWDPLARASRCAPLQLTVCMHVVSANAIDLAGMFASPPLSGLVGALDAAAAAWLVVTAPLAAVAGAMQLLCRAQLSALHASWRMMRSRYRAGLAGRPATPFEQARVELGWS
jgi:hypothetical protein